MCSVRALWITRNHLTLLCTRLFTGLKMSENLEIKIVAAVSNFRKLTMLPQFFTWSASARSQSVCGGPSSSLSLAVNIVDTQISLGAREVRRKCLFQTAKPSAARSQRLALSSDR
jgi:hypothetical protein